MTVKCAPKLNTKHECKNGNQPFCDLDQVKIHMVLFEATPNKHEYFINTHADKPSRAMYYTDENQEDSGWVVSKSIEASWKVGSTWIIEKIECKEEFCPVFIRAAGLPHKGKSIKTSIDKILLFMIIISQIFLRMEASIWN